MNLYPENTPRVSLSLGEHTRTSQGRESATFFFENGTVRFRPIPGGIFRITCSVRDEFENLPSFAVEEEPECSPYELTENTSSFTIRSGPTVLEVDKLNGGITYFDPTGKAVAADTAGAFVKTEWGIRFVRRLSPDAHIYGLGEKTGFLDKRGRRYQMWNTDDPHHAPDTDPLYKTIPFYISFDGERAHGFFTDRSCRSFFDFGFSLPDAEVVDIYDDECDLYFFPGPAISEVVTAYTELTGRMELPPLWSLGYQQCRWSYFPEETVLSIANKMREKEIPCDVIYLDIDYMKGFRVFTWDPERFPDPKGMIKKLSDMGFKVVTIIDPGIKKDTTFPVYLNGVRRDLFCRRSTGEVYTGKVWPGGVAFPDFTRREVRAWWAENHRNHFAVGVAGIWNDMNEPSDAAPAEAVMKNTYDRTVNTVDGDVILENDGHPGSFDRYHNAYGLCMNKAARMAFKDFSTHRPFILTRSAYAGVQKYAAVWSGDNHSWWEHIADSIPMHINIGLSGIPFVGGDIGGFAGNASGELFARWMQAGVFTPFCRSHSASGTKTQEPWAFGNEIENICRYFIRLRYRLMPYIYSEFRDACRTGLPVMRPLVLDFQNDKITNTLDDQFLFGKSLMAAPVYRPGIQKRSVYIPEGGAYDFWTDEYYEGKQFILADAPLEKMPLYVLASSVIPEISPQNYAGENMIEDYYIIHLYPGDQKGKFVLYEDDGYSYRYKNGEYNETAIGFSREEEGVRFSVEIISGGYESPRKKLRVILHSAEGFYTDSKGCITAEQYDPEKNLFSFSLPVEDLSTFLGISLKTDKNN